MDYYNLKKIFRKVGQNDIIHPIDSPCILEEKGVALCEIL